MSLFRSPFFGAPLHFPTFSPFFITLFSGNHCRLVCSSTQYPQDVSGTKAALLLHFCNLLRFAIVVYQFRRLHIKFFHLQSTEEGGYNVRYLIRPNFAKNTSFKQGRLCYSFSARKICGRRRRYTLSRRHRPGGRRRGRKETGGVKRGRRYLLKQRTI